MDAARSATVSADRPQRRLRLVPPIAAGVVLLSLVWLLEVFLRPAAVADTAEPAPLWPLLVGVGMIAAGLGGLATLTWTARRLPALSAGARAAERHADPDAGPPGAQGPWSLLLDLGDTGYWEADARGRYSRIDPPGGPSGSRLRALFDSGPVPLPGDDQAAADLPLRERRVRLADGSTMTVRESGRAVVDSSGRRIGYRGVVRDLSGERPREPVTDTLNVLARAPMPALLVSRRGADAPDPCWSAVWANQALAALSEFDGPDLQQRPLAHWLLASAGPSGDRDPQDGAPAGRDDDRRPALAKLLDQRRETRCAGLLIDRFGQRHPVRLTIEPLPSDRAGHLALVLVDHLQPALERMRDRVTRIENLERTLEQRARETEAASRELENLTHTVRHDLRQPIRHIDGFARILQEDHSALLDPTGREHINRILNAAHRMGAMIDALLEAQQVAAHAIARDPVDLSELARQAADDLRRTEPQVAARFTIEPHVGCRGDPVLLRMVVWNLFENAWKYSARSACREIRFSATIVDGRQVFEVADNGIGFDMAYADRIFGLFHRLHGPSEFSGTGVGLATVQRIVRRHHGRIWAEATPGQGAVFRFTLWEDEA